jgi:hypothetical protein
LNRRAWRIGQPYRRYRKLHQRQFAGARRRRRRIAQARRGALRARLARELLTNQQGTRDHQNVMAQAEIIGRDGECYGHRRRRFLVRSGLRRSKFADRSNAPMATIEVTPTQPVHRKEKSMLSNVKIAAVAALLVASIAPIEAYAQSHDGAALMPGQSRHLKARVPANAHGSVAAPDAFPAVRSGGRWFETDPDPRIRFEMNRDDRDRRAN